MEGRIEAKIKVETKIKEKIHSAPDYMKRFYTSLSSKSYNTKERYVEIVIRFLLHIGNGKYPTLEQLKGVGIFEIEEYLTEISYIKKNGEIVELQPSTYCNIHSSISKFFSFLLKYEYIEKNPFDGGMVERPKLREKDVICLDKNEVTLVEKAIIDGVGNATSVSKQADWKYRDFLLFWLPVINGIRVGALSQINVDDINLEGKYIEVIEKGDRYRKIYFDDKAFKVINMWLVQRRMLLNGEKCDAFFISNRRKRITVRSIEMIIDKYVFAAIGKHLSPHKLRATFATNLYAAKRDIQLVSKALGHKTTAPVQKYVKMFDKDISNAVNMMSGIYE